MVAAGALTYPLYLLHEDLGSMFMRHFPAASIGWIDHRLTITLLALLLILAAAYAVARWVERPLAPRVRRWLSAPRPAATALHREPAHG